MKKKLKELALLVNGYAFKSQNYCDQGIRVIRIANVQDGYISDESPCFYPIESTEKLGQANLHANDLLMSLTGNVGRVALLGREFLPAGLNQRVECIRPFDESDKEYLFCYFRSKSFLDKVTHATTGCAQQNLSIKWLENHFVPVYKKEKRTEIVTKIDSFDKAIQSKKNELEYLNELIKSRFIEMFGDILTNERKWPIKRLGDVCRVINGRAYSAPELLDSGKYKVLRVGNFFTNDSWYFSDLELPADKYCEKGDLLFAWSASFGPRIWDGDKVIYHYHIWKLQDYENALDKIFFFEELNWIVEDLKKKQHGSTMSHFTKGDMENEQLSVPPIELQTQFRSFYELIDKSKFVVHSKYFLWEFLTLFSSTMAYSSVVSILA